jgi:hypothetical protein
MPYFRPINANKLIFFAYSVLSILSIVYYLERTVFTEMSIHIFSLLKDKTHAIQNFRFVAFITQSFPLLGLKAGPSLSGIATVYSLAFSLL